MRSEGKKAASTNIENNTNPLDINHSESHINAHSNPEECAPGDLTNGWACLTFKVAHLVLLTSMPAPNPLIYSKYNTTYLVPPLMKQHAIPTSRLHCRNKHCFNSTSELIPHSLGLVYRSTTIICPTCLPRANKYHPKSNVCSYKGERMHKSSAFYVF